VSRIFFFIFLSILPYKVVAQGKLALYLDYDCRTPSQLLPSVSVLLSTCLVPVGADSIAIQAEPACESGTASLIMYEDASCARDTFSTTGSYTGWSDVTNCFYLYVSKNIPGVMFTCDDPASVPQPTSILSITASIIAGVATSAAGRSTTTSIANANPTTQSGSESNASSSGSTASNSSPTTSSKSSSGGLATSDKIAIGVGLGVGIPSIIIALLTWCLPRR